jgi:hypothetical protein
MTEMAHPNVLDRNAPREFVQAEYAAQLEVLSEVVNYGTNLLVRCMATNKQRFESPIALSVLSQAIRMLDGFHVLISVGAVDTAKLQQRAIFEAYLNLAWILREDSEKRSRDYLVWYLRRQLARLHRVKEGTEANNDLKTDLVAGSIPFDTSLFSSACNEVDDHLDRIRSLLSTSPLKETSEQFDMLPPRQRHAPWYVLSGVNNLRMLAHRLNERAVYDVIYTELSDVAHALNMSDHVKVGSSVVEFEPVRNLADLRRDFVLTSSLAMQVYRVTLSYFRPEELPNFATKFATEWRTRLHAAPEIEIKSQFADI